MSFIFTILQTYSRNIFRTKAYLWINTIINLESGNTVVQAIRVLKEYNVREEKIILLTLFSTQNGYFLLLWWLF